MSKTHPAPVRKIINLPEDMAREISEFRHTHRLPSENEAIRQLLQFALEKFEDDASRSPDHARRSVTPRVKQ
jgi:metal-responsive CopG/Arc/MetJ family transcriptional regulator